MIIHEFNADPLESQAAHLKMKVLEFCGSCDMDSTAVALGIADVLATVAVTLDRQAGTQSLQDRLHAFCQRVEETYNLAQAAASTLRR